jgi:hypothetical protein
VAAHRRAGVLHQPRGHDRARHHGEQHEGEQGDEEGQQVEFEEAVRLGLVVDKVQPGQQGLESAVRGVGADDQGEEALGRDGARPDTGQPLDLCWKMARAAWGSMSARADRLFADLADRQHGLVEADQDRDRRKHRQQGEEGHPARIEHHVAAPAAGERPNRQPAPETMESLPSVTFGLDVNVVCPLKPVPTTSTSDRV